MFHSVDRHDHRRRQSHVEQVLQAMAADETDASVAGAAASAAGRKRQRWG